jgi:hypothetical protein
MRKNTETLIHASREVGLEVNTGIWLSHHQNRGQTIQLLKANKSFENIAKFIYLGTTVTNPKCFNENKIKSRLYQGMVASIRLTNICLPVSSLQKLRLKYINDFTCSCMALKICLSH